MFLPYKPWNINLITVLFSLPIHLKGVWFQHILSQIILVNVRNLSKFRKISSSTYKILTSSLDTLPFLRSFDTLDLSDPTRTCRICQKDIDPSSRQNHMGGHILRRICGIVESATTHEVFSRASEPDML